MKLLQQHSGGVTVSVTTFTEEQNIYQYGTDGNTSDYFQACIQAALLTSTLTAMQTIFDGAATVKRGAFASSSRRQEDPWVSQTARSGDTRLGRLQ